MCQMLDQPLCAMQVIDDYQYEEYTLYRINTLYGIPKINTPSSIFSPRFAFLFFLLN